VVKVVETIVQTVINVIQEQQSSTPSDQPSNQSQEPRSDPVAEAKAAKIAAEAAAKKRKQEELERRERLFEDQYGEDDFSDSPYVTADASLIDAPELDTGWQRSLNLSTLYEGDLFRSFVNAGGSVISFLSLRKINNIKIKLKLQPSNEDDGDDEIPPLAMSSSPSGWSDYQELQTLMPVILQQASDWNPADSGLSDQEFAALMIAILHEEARLRRRAGELEQFGGRIVDAISDQGMISDGANRSVGIANVRPSVAEQIFNGEIPIPTLDNTMLQFDPEYSANLNNLIVRYNSALQADNALNGGGQPNLYQFLSDDAVSVELLAANIYRGIRRAQELGLDPTLANLAAWQNQGIQGRQYSEARGDVFSDATSHTSRVLFSFFDIVNDPTAFGLSADQLANVNLYDEYDRRALGMANSWWLDAWGSIDAWEDWDEFRNE
jgi:hypothetical protein